MEKDIPCKRKSEETRSNNIHIRQTYFEIRTVTKDKEKYYRIIKGSIQEDITIVSIYVPNIGAHQYIRQILTIIKGEIDSNSIMQAQLLQSCPTLCDPMDCSKGL